MILHHYDFINDVWFLHELILRFFYYFHLLFIIFDYWFPSCILLYTWSTQLVTVAQHMRWFLISLFTKVPTDKTLAVVGVILTTDPFLEKRTCIPIDNLLEVFTFCVVTTYFGFGSDTYRQEEGLAFGQQYWPTYTWNTSKKWH